MGRPIKEGLDYFPHDTDAVNDEKIESMRSLFGAAGYAFYFISLERIYRTKLGQLDISSKERRAFLTGRIGVTDEQFMEMLEAAFEVGLFDRKAFENKGVMTGTGLKRRVQQVNGERARKRQWKNDKLSTEKTQNSSGVLDGDNAGKSTQRKAKKRKENIPPISPKGDAGVFEKYAGDDSALLQALKDFNTMRNKIKKPMTDRAKSMLTTKLDGLAESSKEKMEILDEAVLHCWRSVYPLKDKEKVQDDEQERF
ncbi:MAG: DUF4373 domain-containing protein [Pseudoflavonifractor sp.]|nr:DUF4373 domain-containing protein [Pseudoflavonifractor sp.]